MQYSDDSSSFERYSKYTNNVLTQQNDQKKIYQHTIGDNETFYDLTISF